MCNSRYYDAISVGISLLIGIAVGVLALLELLIVAIVTPVLALLFAVLCLLLLTLLAISPLRKSEGFARCLCQKGMRLLIGALGLLVIGGISLIFTPIATLPIFIVNFLIFTLLTYTLFSLYYLLKCAVRIGCDFCGCGEPAANGRDGTGYAERTGCCRDTVDYAERTGCGSDLVGSGLRL